MMNREQVEILRNEVKLNPIASEVFHLLAMRIRPRHTLTVSAIYQKMLTEGFKHSKQEYVPIVKALAKAGIGVLDFNSRGRVRGIKDIKATLQSVGAAALGTGENFKPYNRKERKAIQRVSTPRVLKTLVKQVVPSHKMTIKIIVSLNGKPIEINIPNNLTSAEVAKIISTINS